MDQTTSAFSQAADRDEHIEIDAPATLQWLHYTIAGMVDNEDAVEIEGTIGNEVTTFNVAVAKGDLGKVIGGGGRYARAIRGLLFARSGKDRCRYSLNIVDMAGGN